MNKSFRKIAFKHLVVPLIVTLFLFIVFSYLVITVKKDYVTMNEQGLLIFYVLLFLLIVIGFFCSGILLISLIFFILRGFPITAEKYRETMAQNSFTYLSVELFCVSFFPKKIDKISEEFYKEVSKQD